MKEKQADQVKNALAESPPIQLIKKRLFTLEHGITQK